VGIIVGFALCFQRIKDKNLTLDSHLFLPLFLRRTHVNLEDKIKRIKIEASSQKKKIYPKVDF